MKAGNIYPRIRGLFIIPFVVLCLTLTPELIQAQDSGGSGSSGKYSRAELVQMLAPIALYPDALLSQILMAATYPVEVIEADRWVRSNPELKDASLDAALVDQDWDPSVKAICHFPSILALMSERINETTDLGDAFLAEEAEVMEVIQKLRAEAYAQGNLTTSTEQKVIREKETIIIEPANPRVIYVPYYDPLSIYGTWWYPDYPPYYWDPRGARLGFGISYWSGISFSFTFGAWSRFDWPRHSLYIDAHRRPRFVRPDRWPATAGRWQHARRRVVYREQSTVRKHARYPLHAQTIVRDAHSFPERQVRKHEQRNDSRPVVVRHKSGEERSGIVRDPRQRQRNVLQRKPQETTVRARQGQPQRTQGNRHPPERPRQERMQTDRDHQERRMEREQPGRNRDNAVNRSEFGNKDGRSSERGRTSRKDLGDNSGAEGQSVRNDRGRGSR